MARAENALPRHELASLATILAQQFIQRRDMYPRQLEDGGYVTVHSPLPERLVTAHLAGEETLGAYVLDAQSRARFMVLDADDEPDRRRLVALSRVLSDLQCPTYFEASRRGGHLWFFFDSPLPGRQIRRFGAGLAAYFNLASIELYPKQGTLRSGPGSLIRLPFGIHRKSGRRYGFYTPNGEPLGPTLREQIMALQAPQAVPERLFDHYASYAAAPRPRPVFEASDAVGEQVSDRVKAAISCYGFIGQYVSLTSDGRGQCPFHDDRVASFSVNRQENYWHCFAGCGGGSIIDFYMLYRQHVEGRPGDFKTTVTELARMLLTPQG